MSEISKRRWLTYDTPHADLRDFIDRADEAGEHEYHAPTTPTQCVS